MKTSVVVANHGRDLTLLKNSLPRGVEFIEINEGLERSIQRNMGIAKATGEIVIWLDSDQSLGPGLVEECELLLSSRVYKSVYIPEIIVAKSFFGKIRKFEREFYTGTAVDVPRAVLKRVCPKFNEELNGPEDADWGNRIIGLRAISKSVLYHHDDIGFCEYFRKKAYYAKSMKKYKELNPTDRVLDWKYRCFEIFVEKGKWRKLIAHPILAAGIAIIIFGRALIYLRNK